MKRPLCVIIALCCLWIARLYARDGEYAGALGFAGFAIGYAGLAWMYG